MPVRLILAAVAAVGFSLGSAASTPHPKTVSALAQIITAKGLGCHDFQAEAPPLDQSSGTCTVGHEYRVSLDVFPTHAALTRSMPKAITSTCAALRQVHSSQKFVFVIGWNWVATFESKVNANPLAKATGAKTQALKCS
jgi:hypothetical protein